MNTLTQHCRLLVSVLSMSRPLSAVCSNQQYSALAIGSACHVLPDVNDSQQDEIKCKVISPAFSSTKPAINSTLLHHMGSACLEECAAERISVGSNLNLRRPF